MPSDNKRAAAHGAQIVEQRQEYQGEIAAAGKHPFEIGGQLDHGAHQRIEPVSLALLIVAGADQVAGNVLHLLGEQRGPIYLDQTQHTVRKVQLLGAFLQE